MKTHPSTTISSTLLRQQFDAAPLLEATVADVTTEQAHWMRPGIANQLGAGGASIGRRETSPTLRSRISLKNSPGRVKGLAGAT